MPDLRVTVEGTDRILRALDRLYPVTARHVREAVAESALTVQRGARELAPVRTGRGRASIAIRFPTLAVGYAAEVFTNVLHMILQHRGTRPHIIRARNAKALAFQPGAVASDLRTGRAQFRVQRGRRAGEVTSRQSARTLAFAKFVRHPGTGARPFLDAAWADERPAFLRRIDEALHRATVEA